MSLFVIRLFITLKLAVRTSVRFARMLPVVFPVKVLFSMRAVKMLLFAVISKGTLEMEVWSWNVLFEQSRVDVPFRVKKIPLVLFRN